jgi:hypothetical protein
MKRLLSVRPEYQQYVNDCLEACEVPVSFREWFQSAYYYDLQDQLPTGEQYQDWNDWKVLCLN